MPRNRFAAEWRIYCSPNDILFVNHRLDTLISSGATSEVWSAVRVGPHGFAQPVALKTLVPARAQSQAHVRAFLQEARIASHVQHRSVVQVRDLLVQEDRHWLCMELVRGWSLQQLIAALKADGRTLPFEVAITLVREAASGLQAIHDAGLIHRHITPSNIMVSTSGHVVVLDFGCAAWQLSEQVRFTRPMVELEPSYASPQMLCGERVDARTDLYSLGAVLHELIFGEPPSGPPRSSRSDVPVVVKDVITRSLERDAAARFGSAREVEMVLDLISFRHCWPITPSYVAAYLDEVLIRTERARLPPWPKVSVRDTDADAPAPLPPAPRVPARTPQGRIERDPRAAMRVRAPSEASKTRVRLRRRPQTSQR